MNSASSVSCAINLWWISRLHPKMTKSIALTAMTTILLLAVMAVQILSGEVGVTICVNLEFSDFEIMTFMNRRVAKITF